MTPEKIQQVIKMYRTRLSEFVQVGIDYPNDKKVLSPGSAFCHCYGMLDKMLGFLEEGRIEKTHRWLGFIQGCMWSMGIYTLEDLKNHNRPD